MAKVKDFISKATGLIGQAAVDYAPIAMAKENALRETEAAATKLKQDKLELLYKENIDTIGKIYDYAAKSIGGMTPDLQQQIDDLTYRNKILRGAMFGVDLSAEQQAAIEDMISGKEVSEKKVEDETSNIIPDWLAKFGKFVGAKTLEGLEALGNAEIDILSNALGVVIDSRYDNLFSKKKVELGSKRTYTAERGQKDLNRDAIAEIFKDLSSKISEEGIIDIFKESAKGKLSPQVASIINKILGFSAISPNYVFEQSSSDTEQGLISQGSQAQMNRVPLGSGVPLPASGGPEGMFYEEAPITSEQQAYEDARNEAALSGSGSAQIGSDAAIRSLYEDVGGPVGEPAGDTIT